MKPHHLLGILCIALLACFGALLVVYFNQASDMLVLEKELALVTAERDQLVSEIESLKKNLEGQKAAFEDDLNTLRSQLSHIQEQYNKLYDEITPDREYPELLEKAFEDARKRNQP